MILLTGATGFIGSHLLEHLLKEKYKVLCLIRYKSDTWRINHLINNENLRIINTLSINDFHFENLFKENKIDTIIHLATSYYKDDKYEYIENMIESIITLPSLLLKLGTQYKVKQFITTDTYFKNPFGKDDGPLNLYATYKKAFNNVLEYYSKNYFINCINLVLYNVFGEKDNNKVIPMVINKALKDESIVFEKPLEKVSFVYVGHVVSSILKYLKTKYTANHIIQHYCTDKRLYTVKDIVDFIEEILNKEISYIFKDQRIVNKIYFEDYNYYIYSEESLNLKEDLKKTIDYYKENLKI